jgi:hypothetical protein
MPQLPHPLFYHDRDRRPATNNARSGTTVRTEGSARLHREREGSRTCDAGPSSPRGGGGHGSRGPAEDAVPGQPVLARQQARRQSFLDRTPGRNIGSLPGAEISPDQDPSTGTERVPRLQKPNVRRPRERLLARRWLAPRRREVAFGRHCDHENGAGENMNAIVRPLRAGRGRLAKRGARRAADP